jgi:hypothetical protein
MRIETDLTWATANVARSHGRAPRSVRVVAPVPYGAMVN